MTVVPLVLQPKARIFDIGSSDATCLPLLAVPVGTTWEVFQYNSSFAAPPPQEGGSEPVWDSMIPSKSKIRWKPVPSILKVDADGLGYIKDKTIASNTSVLSAFHQLHCLVSHGNHFQLESRLTKYSTPSAEPFIQLQVREI